MARSNKGDRTTMPIWDWGQPAGYPESETGGRVPPDYDQDLADAQARAGLPPDGLRGPHTRAAGL